MAMLVVRVGDMRMLVGQRSVGVEMRVGLPLDRSFVRVLMVRVVRVQMVVG